MSDAWGPPWSDNPNAPQIPLWLYSAEKTNFAGFLIGAIFYGIVIALFFQCMGALLNPMNFTTKGVRWGLLAHTVAMFSFVTIFTAINLDIQSISYIDNRDFPGDSFMLPPGPLGYQFLIYSKAISVVPNIMFYLNTCLSDGLLLYRCYVTYAMNYWVIAFPCLMFLASFAIGIAFIWEIAQTFSLNSNSVTIADFGTPYYAISISLNVLLTLMIVVRLVLHRKNIRKAMGARAAGLYGTAATLLVESCALYAVSYILFIGPWAIGSPVSNIFFPILAETQVIAPFLIILRVANQTALTNDVIVSGNVDSIRFGNHGRSTNANETLPDRNPASSTDVFGKPPGDIGLRVVTSLVQPSEVSSVAREY